MEQMSLQQIAKVCGGTLCLPRHAADRGVDGNTLISGAELDSRKIEPGDLFFAVPGERVDGHKFISDVYQKKAVCVITEKSPEEIQELYQIPLQNWGAYIQVKDTLEALKETAEYYRSTLNIPVIGITGSVGKTSTKEFIAGVLSEGFRVLKTEGNFNNEIGLPLTILRIRREHEVAVLEMGISDFGEMHRLSKIAKPDICVITNIGQCHLENLKSRDGILKAKTEIFDYMMPDGEVCLNGEDDKLAAVTTVHGKNTHFFGLGGNSSEEVYADKIVSRGLFGSHAVLHLKQEGLDNKTTAQSNLSEQVLEIQVPLPGIHMVSNAAAAACVARLLGLTPEQMKEGISKVQPVGGRSNLIKLDEFTIIDDCYNANPVSMKAAIELLNMADTVKTVIMGDMFELGEDSENMHTQVGAYAAEAGIDTIICIGESGKYIYTGAEKAGSSKQKIIYFKDKQELFSKLDADREELIPTGSTVLIKASHGMGFTEIVEWLKD